MRTSIAALLISCFAFPTWASDGVAVHVPGKKAVYAIRVPALAKNQTAVSFVVHITNGAVLSVSGLPIGWSTRITNEPSWGNDGEHKTTIDAGMIMGTIDAKGLGNIHFRVKKGAPGPIFVMDGSMETVMLPDLEHPTSIELKPENFQIVK